jgi:Ethanolamine utilization protein EutJ (predicted chaperonin)
MGKGRVWITCRVGREVDADVGSKMEVVAVVVDEEGRPVGGTELEAESKMEVVVVVVDEEGRPVGGTELKAER